jgi:hypothetical protein
MSYKIAKIIYAQMNNINHDKAQTALKSVRLFLQIEDEFKQHRIEWLLGISQVGYRAPYTSAKYTIGMEEITRINDEAY